VVGTAATSTAGETVGDADGDGIVLPVSEFELPVGCVTQAAPHMGNIRPRAIRVNLQFRFMMISFFLIMTLPTVS
jgi:hypothetical protein